MELKIKQKVHVIVAETSSLGGGSHRGVIENIVPDMYDGTPLYLIKVKGTVITAREGAITPYKTNKIK